jgi:hypothetical protein
MPIQYRRVEPADIPKCVNLVAGDPVVGPRYGAAIANLGPAMLRLIESPSATQVLFEEVDAARTKVWGMVSAAFVTDAFMREVKTPPLFWIGPEFARRIIGPDPPVLSEAQLRAANSTSGVNILVLQGCIRPEGVLEWAETYRSGMAMFFEDYGGYKIREIVGVQADSPRFLASMFQGGAMLWNPENGSWMDAPAADLHNIASNPHLVGMARELAAARPGSWYGSIFNYRPPQAAFSRSQQRLLLTAFKASTDDELAEILGISRSAVKKAWLKIYDRVGARVPALVPDNELGSDSRRGKEKKRRLLSYLRQHPEELRPTSQKLLSKSRRERLEIASV